MNSRSSVRNQIGVAGMAVLSAVFVGLVPLTSTGPAHAAAVKEFFRQTNLVGPARLGPDSGSQPRQPVGHLDEPDEPVLGCQ